MDGTTACKLIALNNDFYAVHAESFFATRQNRWPGWERCLKLVGLGTDGAGAGAVRPSRPVTPGDAPAGTAPSRGDASARGAKPLNLLDLACGNLRFETFLHRACPGVSLCVTAVDNCRPLIPTDLAPDTTCLELDVLSALLEEGHAVRPDGSWAAGPLPLGGPYDLVVSFGFMHHVPGADLRRRLVDALLDVTRPGGHVVLSFWNFTQDRKLAARAAQTTERALGSGRLGIDPDQLDRGDYLLGWQNNQDTCRYCHDFSAAEVDALAATVANRACVVTTFAADGRTQSMNIYLVLQRLA